MLLSALPAVCIISWYSDIRTKKVKYSNSSENEKMKYSNPVNKKKPNQKYA